METTKQLIERAAIAAMRETAQGVEAGEIMDREIEMAAIDHMDAESKALTVKLFSAFLARINAERGKDATAWRVLNRDFKDTLRLTESDIDVAYLKAEGYTCIPLFLSAPSIREGYALVDKKLLALAIDLTREAGEEEFSRLPLSDELHGLSLMLAAAQGERNAD